MENGDFGFHECAREKGTRFCEFLADLGDLCEKWNRSAIRTEKRAVILLLAVQGAAPLPVADGVRTVANGVPGHGTDFALIEGVVDARPVHGAGLRFHHPEILLLEAARQVVGEAVLRGVEMALANVVVPGGEIEVLYHSVVVVAIEPAHGVGGDEFGWVRVGAQYFELIFLVAAPGIADEAHPAQQQTRIAVTHLEGNLVPGSVTLAPVGGG